MWSDCGFFFLSSLSDVFVLILSSAVSQEERWGAESRSAEQNHRAGEASCLERGQASAQPREKLGTWITDYTHTHTPYTRIRRVREAGRAATASQSDKLVSFLKASICWTEHWRYSEQKFELHGLQMWRQNVWKSRIMIGGGSDELGLIGQKDCCYLLTYCQDLIWDKYN